MKISKQGGTKRRRVLYMEIAHWQQFTHRRIDYNKGSQRGYNSMAILLFSSDLEVLNFTKQSETKRTSVKK